MKKILLRTVVALVVLIVLAVVAVFFSLNAMTKKGVETFGPPMTKTEVSLGSADISPFSGRGKLSELFVGNPTEYTNTGFAIKFSSVAVAIKIGSVLSDTVIVDSIDIEQPDICLEGTLNGNNLNQILDNLNSASASQEQQKNTPAPSGQKPKKFIVKDLVLNGAKVRVDVSALGKSLDKTISIPDIHLQNIGTGDGGVTIAALCQQLFKPVVTETIKSATDELEKNGIDKVTKGASTELKNSAQGVLNNLLNKK